MKRKRKRKLTLTRVLTGLAALIAAFVAAGYAVLANLSQDDLRDLARDQVKQATGRDLVIAGAIDLEISTNLRLVLDQVSLTNAPWGSRPELATIARVELQLALLPLLSGELRVERLVLIEPDILLEKNDQGRGNWAVGESAEPVAAVLSFGRIEIRDGRVSLPGGRGDAPAQLVLAALSAESESRTSPIHLVAEGSYNAAPFTLDAVLGSIEALRAGPLPIEARGKIAGAAFEVRGGIAEPATGRGLEFELAVSGRDLALLGPPFGAELPSLGPYELATGLVRDGESLKLSDLALKLGASDLAGAATIDLGGARPAVTGAFTSALLDLADLGMTPKAGGPAGSAGRFVFPDAPLPLDALRALDAEVTLTAARLRVEPRLELSDLEATLTLAGGRLSVAPLAAGLAGGTLRVEVELDGAKQVPALAARAKGAAIDYGRLLKLYGVSDQLSGTLDLDFDLVGRGFSPRALASGLNGEVALSSTGGRIDNRLLKLVGVGLGDILGPLLGGEDSAKLNCIVGRFDIDDGLATSRALVFDSESFTVAGGGTVDLKTEGLDLQMDTSTRRPSLASLAIPFNVGGTLAAPSFVPNPLAAAVGAAKSVESLIGGTVGELGALIGRPRTSESGNPCDAALAAVRGDAAAAKPAPTIVDQAGEVVEDAAKGLGKAIKGLFGD